MNYYIQQFLRYDKMFLTCLNSLFSVRCWLQSVKFVPYMLPMGPMAYHLGICPITEFSIEGTGILCREGLPPGKVLTHPWNLMDKKDQLRLLYEDLYTMHPIDNIDTINSTGRDPLFYVNELLLRHVDSELTHRCCVGAKYPR